MCLLNEVFGSLNSHSLLRSDSIEIDMSKFEKIYPDDVNLAELRLEISRFNRLVQSRGFTLKNDATALDVLQWLSKHRLCKSKPYVFMCLKLYLTVAVSIASCERSFSKLKLIKSCLRSTMGESRLSALGKLSIESDLVETLSFDDIIPEFASMKARRIELRGILISFYDGVKGGAAVFRAIIQGRYIARCYATEEQDKEFALID